jgi:hypothetical protein
MCALSLIEGTSLCYVAHVVYLLDLSTSFNKR